MLNNIIHQMIIYAVPILLASLGGLLAYRLNIINIGLEGIMVFGALASALVIYFTGNYIMGLLTAVVVSAIIGLIFAVFSVHLNANFVITGFAINILSLALGSFLVKSLDLTQIDTSVVRIDQLTFTIPLIDKIPLIGPILSGHTPMVYITVLLYVFISIFLNKTKAGTYIKVIGENQSAALSVGIRIKTVKYITLVLSAVIVGLGGFSITVEQVRLFTPGVIAGTGFIAIAAIYCGNGRPVKTALYAAIFGLTKSLSLNLAFGNSTLEGLLKMVPYVTIIIVLTIVGMIEHKNKLVRGVTTNE